MAYKVIILYQLYMPSYFLGTFTEYPYKVSPETVRLFYLRTLLKKPKKTPEEEIQEQNPIEKPET